MKAFRFRLQTNLNLAAGQEKLAQEELQKAMQYRDQLARELDYAYNRLHNIQDELREMLLDAVPFARVILVKQYMPVLMDMIHNLQDQLNRAEEIVEIGRASCRERVYACV